MIACDRVFESRYQLGREQRKREDPARIKAVEVLTVRIEAEYAFLSSLALSAVNSKTSHGRGRDQGMSGLRVSPSASKRIIARVQ